MALLTEQRALGNTTNSMTEEEMLKSGRLTVVHVSLPCLVGLMRNGADGRFVKVDGLPEDAVIVGISEHYRFRQNEVTLRVWSETFDVVLEGNTIPELELKCSLWE